MNKNILALSAFSLMFCFGSVDAMEQKKSTLNPDSQSSILSSSSDSDDELDFSSFIEKTWPEKNFPAENNKKESLNEFFKNLYKDEAEDSDEFDTTFYDKLLDLDQERVAAFEWGKNSFFGKRPINTRRQQEKTYSLFSGLSINSVFNGQEPLTKKEGVLTPDLLDFIVPYTNTLCGNSLANEINQLKDQYRNIFNAKTTGQKEQFIVDTMAKNLKVIDFIGKETGKKIALGVQCGENALFIRPFPEYNEALICHTYLPTQEKKQIMRYKNYKSSVLHFIF